MCDLGRYGVWSWRGAVPPAKGWASQLARLAHGVQTPTEHCENADEGNRADDPHTLRAAHQPTSLVGTTPLAAAKSLDGLRGRGQELEAAHLRGRLTGAADDGEPPSRRTKPGSPRSKRVTSIWRQRTQGVASSPRWRCCSAVAVDIASLYGAPSGAFRGENMLFALWQAPS